MCCEGVNILQSSVIDMKTGDILQDFEMNSTTIKKLLTSLDEQDVEYSCHVDAKQMSKMVPRTSIGLILLFALTWIIGILTTRYMSNQDKDGIKKGMKKLSCGNFRKCKTIIMFDKPKKTLCSGCRQIHYCTRKCQKWHWKYNHRSVCLH